MGPFGRRNARGARGRGLRCQSAHMGFERLRDDYRALWAEAKAVGALWVVCPWIPHKDNAFTRDEALKAAEAFNGFDKAASEAGLRFGYHCHGYEFVPSAEGTLFDNLAGALNPRVMFQRTSFTRFTAAPICKAHRPLQRSCRQSSPEGSQQKFPAESGRRDRSSGS